MRPDMAKVLTERPRSGGNGWRKKGRAPRDLDLLRAKVSGRRLHKELGNWKSFGEHLGPLRRFAEAQEGRPWNRVFAEMREHIKPGNTVQEHVLTHLDDYLSIKVRKVAVTPRAPCGLVDVGGRWRAGMPRGVAEGRLYVDPDDGIIKRARRKLKGPRSVPASTPLRPRRWGGGWLISIEGRWHGLHLAAYSIEHPLDGAAVFVVADRRMTVWRDPIEGTVWPHQSAKLERIADRYGAGWLAADCWPLHDDELGWHGLPAVRAR